MPDQDLIKTRWTPSKFDAALVAYVAEGKLLTARYACSGRVWKAELNWKPGYERATKVLTAYDERSLKSALLNVDASLKFLGQVNPTAARVETAADGNAAILEAMRADASISDAAYINACRRWKVKPQSRTTPSNTAQAAAKSVPVLSAADQRTLEAMRVDPTVSVQAYRNACAKFGVQPQPRPTQAATPASQSFVPFHVQGTAYGAFMQAHGELFTGIFAEGNAAAIAQWMHDENRQIDAASLDQCYRELKAANCFRTAATLTRGMNGALQIFQPYSRERIVRLRNQQTAETASAPPDYLSDVEKDVWRAVRQAYPALSVRSAGFQDCCKRTLLKWATDFAVENDPSLAAANKKGELRKAVDAVLNSWAKISHPNRKVDDKGKTLIWLG
jgi:hypothetical protein